MSRRRERPLITTMTPSTRGRAGDQPGELRIAQLRDRPARCRRPDSARCRRSADARRSSPRVSASSSGTSSPAATQASASQRAAAARGRADADAPAGRQLACRRPGTPARCRPSPRDRGPRSRRSRATGRGSRVASRPARPYATRAARAPASDLPILLTISGLPARSAFSATRRKVRDVLDVLDQHQKGVGLAVVEHVLDEVERLEAGFVAGRDDVVERQAPSAGRDRRRRSPCRRSARSPRPGRAGGRRRTAAASSPASITGLKVGQQRAPQCWRSLPSSARSPPCRSARRWRGPRPAARGPPRPAPRRSPSSG